ncbi:hypothetical protein GCM10017788_77950 [Amycolatopsis acidiphila]|nr:hypothetical protein GCM10017788_77950 [Amycolatopsis acidiphila]
MDTGRIAMAPFSGVSSQNKSGNPDPATRTIGTVMTTAERLRGGVGVAAVTLGTFTLVTNEFIPVGLLASKPVPAERQRANG